MASPVPGKAPDLPHTLPITKSFCIEAALGPASRTLKETAHVHLRRAVVGLAVGFTARVIIVKIK